MNIFGQKNNDPVPVTPGLTRRHFLRLGALSAGAAALAACAPNGNHTPLPTTTLTPLSTLTPTPTETIRGALTGILRIGDKNVTIAELADFFISPTSTRDLYEPLLPDQSNYDLASDNQRLEYQKAAALTFLSLGPDYGINHQWQSPDGATNQMVSLFPGYEVDLPSIDLILGALKNEYGENYTPRNQLLFLSEDSQYGGKNPGDPRYSVPFTEIITNETGEIALTFAVLNPDVPAEVIWALAIELGQGRRNYRLDGNLNHEINANSFGWAAVSAYLGYDWEEYNARIPGSKLYHAGGTHIDLIPVSQTTYSQLLSLKGKEILTPQAATSLTTKFLKACFPGNFDQGLGRLRAQ